MWMNDALYEIASFMYFFESVPWRWSHTRHHTDTIIVGRDPEIAAPRPPDLLGIALDVFSLVRAPNGIRQDGATLLRTAYSGGGDLHSR